MTLYAKQTWADDDITKPLSAARMGVLEDGIYNLDVAAATRKRFISSREFLGQDGSPGSVVDGITPSFSMPDAAAASIVCNYQIPPNVVKIDVQVRYWSRGSGGANACLRFDYQQIVDGVALTTGMVTGTKVALALGATNVPALGTLVTNLAVTPDTQYSLKVYRLPADALDTNSGDAVGIAGILITPKVA